jgi:hypothetical protein
MAESREEMYMSDPSHDQGSQLQFLDELIGSYAEIAGDVLYIGEGTWAIHGSIPVDGDVLVAEYPTMREAVDALARLGPNRVAGVHERIR